ncbi:MAG: RloB family protein [Haloechinothrix sp.]
MVCGGRSTEPTYFRGLKKWVRNPAVKVKIAAQGVDPMKLVEHASVLDRRGEFDDVWCVVDVDEYDLTLALKVAHDMGVKLAISNPCFEYWLLLHFQNCQACLNGYDHVAGRLLKHLPQYDKANLRFDDFSAGVNDAVHRAKQRCPRPGIGEHQHNPSTRVWALVEAITP